MKVPFIYSLNKYLWRTYYEPSHTMGKKGFPFLSLLVNVNLEKETSVALSTTEHWTKG
jgi:hypothetical protein